MHICIGLCCCALGLATSGLPSIACGVVPLCRVHIGAMQLRVSQLPYTWPEQWVTTVCAVAAVGYL
jgi:hypothetical protein